MALTSEKQKEYNLKTPKGGYSYYTLYRGVYDPTNGIDERPTYAETGDRFEPVDSDKVYVCTRRKGKAVWTEDPNAKRQTETGGSGGGSLPADFPAEGSANANKFLGFDANGDYAAKDAPSGGAEKFVVTLTQENDTWTADKTIAEIVAADAANQVVVCKVAYESGGTPTFEIPLFATTDNVVMFGGVGAQEKTMSFVACGVVACGVLDGGVTEWNVGTVELGSTNEPLIVTLTAGSTEGQFVGDKTYEEAFNAFISGRNVVFCASSVPLAETVTAAENNTGAANPYALSTKSFTSSGTANDYITVTAGG